MLLRIIISFFLLAGISLNAKDWPWWRPFDGSAASTESEQQVPLKWSVSENVRWKTPLPDRGNSSPAIWGNHVFLAQALEKEGERGLHCFDASTGKRLWKAGVKHGPEKTHPTNPYCSATPVADGTNVIVWQGSAGVFCYDFKGQERWHKKLGDQVHDWGYGTSPILHSNLCILYFGPGKSSFLIALDKNTGKEVWRRDLPPGAIGPRTDGFANQREGMVGTWSTPILIQANKTNELVLSLPQRLEAFDPMTGKTLWWCDGLNPLVYTSPIYGDGVVVAMGGFLGTTIAVKPGGRGDVSATHKLWQQSRTKNRLGSGLIYQNHIYILNTSGPAECLKLQTGEKVWEESLWSRPRDSWSSMVRVGERIYILNQAAETAVFKASPRFELLTVNALDGAMANSSHAVANGNIYIRTHTDLWCLGKMEKTVAGK